MAYDELRHLRRCRRYAKMDPEAFLKTLLTTMGAVGRKRAPDAQEAESEGTCERARVWELHPAFV